MFAETGIFEVLHGFNRDRVPEKEMREIGYEGANVIVECLLEHHFSSRNVLYSFLIIFYHTITIDCDYISHEIYASFWNKYFAHGKFHGIHMELHIPCREPIDHLLSQCNEKHKTLNCSASTNDYFESVKNCFTHLNRYNSNLHKKFDSIKCYDFKEQFTAYIDYMGERLQKRRIISEPYIKRTTNDPRNKTNECLLQRPDLMERTRNFLLRVDYYKFCNSCIGSENDITSR